MNQSYEIVIRESFPQEWREMFGGLEVLPCQDGGTLLRGDLSDQAALYGLLLRLRDLGLTLVSIQSSDPAGRERN